jgi:hypothetical protein
MARRGNPNWTKGGPSPNPTGKRRADAATSDMRATMMAALDGYMNANTGLGVSGRDKSLGTTFCADVIDPQTAEHDLRRGDPIGARLADMLPDEAIQRSRRALHRRPRSPENYYEPEEPDPLPRSCRVRLCARMRARAQVALNSWERRVVRGQSATAPPADAADSKVAVRGDLATT